jgi:hypothetical protein
VNANACLLAPSICNNNPTQIRHTRIISPHHLKIIFATMATILTSCLEREGQGGHRCIACQNFEEAVQQNASRVINKKRGDTGKLYKCTNKFYMAASPSILRRRNSYSVRGHEACLGSAATSDIPAVPCDGTPKRNRS